MTDATKFNLLFKFSVLIGTQKYGSRAQPSYGKNSVGLISKIDHTSVLYADSDNCFITNSTHDYSKLV